MGGENAFGAALHYLLILSISFETVVFLNHFHSSRVANRAPSANTANLSQATLGWVSLNLRAEAANPQSAPAITFSRPTILAKRRILSATNSGCSTRLVVWLITPGMRIFQSGSFTRSKTWYSCSWRGFAASNE